MLKKTGLRVMKRLDGVKESDTRSDDEVRTRLDASQHAQSMEIRWQLQKEISLAMLR